MWSTRTPLTIAVALVLLAATAVLASVVKFDSLGLTAALAVVMVLTSLTDRDAFYRGIINRPEPQRRRRGTPASLSALRTSLATMLASRRSRP